MLPEKRDGWTFVLCDSLEKVFADERPRAMNQDIPISVFRGETTSWQIAFLPPTVEDVLEHEKLEDLRFTVTAGAGLVTLKRVELVPCSMVAYDNADAGYLRTAPGMYPDLLRPLTGELVRPVVAQWGAVWADVVTGDAGEHVVTIEVASTATGNVLFSVSLVVTVHEEELPPLSIVNTHWFHCDGLSTYYGVEVFSEEHWAIIEKFVAKAAEADINSLLTPTWTPPLDTAIGGTRLPTQLIEVWGEPHGYRFDFSKLVRWLELCERHGIRYIEIAHFFTQWGARFTPAIYIHRDGELQREFGWDVPATDPRYRAFLEALVPELRRVLAEHWDAERVLFHISDEPTAATLDSYSQAKEVVADLLDGARVVDALSDYEFYASGAVPSPVVATDAVQPFIDKGVQGFWVYYCVGQNKDVANRFIGLPSLRNRVLGRQLFAFEVGGFLQWGYNFYNSQLSTRSIDPFLDTSVGGVFPAGDSFLVYPGPDGEPYESIRFRVFAEAMADHRAMSMAAERVGRAAVLAIIDPDGTLAFDRFGYDPDEYRRTREAVNRLVVG